MPTIKEGVTELRHLRYFLAIASEGSFRAGARKLFLSQPTLSHQIQQLSAGELRIGIVSTVNVAVIPEAVGNFRNAHPNVSVSVRELPMEALEAELLAGHLDLGISFLPAKSGRRIEAEPLFIENLVAVLPPGHALARRRRITLPEVLDHPMVLLSHGFCTRELVLESVALQGLEHVLRPAIEMNSIEGVLATVRQTGMLTLMPDAAVRWEHHPDLVIKPLRDAAEQLSFRRVGLIWVSGGHRTAAACTFAEGVKSVLKSRD